MLCFFFFSSVYYTHIQPKLKRQWIILEFISAVAEWDPKEPCVATSVYSFTRFSTKFLWGINGCIMEICGNHQCCDKSVFCVTRLRMWRWIHNILDSWVLKRWLIRSQWPLMAGMVLFHVTSGLCSSKIHLSKDLLITRAESYKWPFLTANVEPW